jgi:Family of unknown function (DUF5961)
MPRTQPKTRTFRVHARHVDAHHARTLKAPTFEAAAVAYVEDLHELPGDSEEINVIVREVESGHEHSFKVYLESGKISPSS